MAAAPPVATIVKESDSQDDIDARIEAASARLPWLRIGPKGGMFSLAFNPVVTLSALAFIWSFCIWSMVNPTMASEEMSEWKTWVTDYWTWLYIVSQDVWIVVLLYLCFTKYRHIKLGRDSDVPEYSDVTYFTMLFSCGVAVGLFYYSVAEPMWHYRGWGGARWMQMDDNTRGEHALMITWFHWGLHGWIPYTTVGALLALVSYRRGLPMTIRFCFEPLMGDRVYGPIGDFIDILSIICTMFGVCTSLGLGVMQINQGLVRLDRGHWHGVDTNPDGEVGFVYSTNTQIGIIWAITALATISVLSGIKRGIRRLSEICFTLGMFLVLCVLFMDDTAFILNLITSTFGYYLWYLPKVSFHTDAFELQGMSPDGLGGGQGWMDSWTIFYWGWWISWAPFTGMFMAKISKGRTLGEFITATLTLPSLYCFFWLGTFGAAGISMDRKAEAMGLDCGDWSGNLSTVFASHMTGDGDDNTVRLWCRGTTDIFFDQITSYGSKDFGDFLSVISLIALILYFITSSDSGSLVIDILGANGCEEPPPLQRVLWALTEGATATALLHAGGSEALNSLQTASIVAGLPYTFVLFWMCQALLRCVLEEEGTLDRNRKRFNSFVMDIDHRGTGIGPALTKIGVNTVAPFVSMGRIAAAVWGPQTMIPSTVAYAGLFLLSIILVACKGVEPALMMMGAVIYLGLVTCMTALRMAVRVKSGIMGDPFTDFITTMCLYPMALEQLEAQIAFDGQATPAFTQVGEA